MSVVYNEIDPFAAAWLRELVRGGHVAEGVVDERSVVDLDPVDVASATQFHTFAGIGVWSHALRLAGWPDDRPVWTGSCPCQPFSAAGKRGGFEDERHLWPAWFDLIRECRPPVIFGEQVASHDGLAWLDAVYADLEGAGYAVGAVDLCAAGVGAPHIRQRLFFVAERVADTFGSRQSGQSGRGSAQGQRTSERGLQGGLVGLADATSRGSLGSIYGAERGPRMVETRPPRNSLSNIGLADDDEAGCGEQRSAELPANRDTSRRNDANGRGAHDGPGPTNGYWRDADWLYCRDAKWRPVEPGSFPLAHGAPARVGRLRGYGNAIVAQAAAAVIRAYMERE